jgi:hypothetical protein
VRRALRDVATTVGIVLALLTAFALVNVAAERALSSALPDWLAPLLLAAAWILVGVVLFLVILRPARRASARRWWLALGADRDETVARYERARDEAREATQATLEQLTDAVAAAAGEQLAQAASGVAGGVVDVGEEILDTTDEITDAIEEAVPGGTVINRAVDLVLVPGRYAMKISRTILVRRDRSGG